MYGKLFASAFTGSMFGAGPTIFAVWSYVVAHTVDSQVELNPKLIAAVLGAEESQVNDAITYLCAPDPRSRNKAHDGRRLVPSGEFSYLVTGHALYRSIRSEEDRRRYNREKQRESRARRKTSNEMSSASTPVKESQARQPRSAHTEADTETEADQDQNIRSAPREKPRRPARSRSLTVPDGFNDFWQAYPRKVAKPNAMQAWRRQQPPLDAVLDAIARTSWHTDPAFRPHPATWLNGRRWEDGSSAAPDTPSVNGLPFAPVTTEHWSDECHRLGHQPPCPNRTAHWVVKERTAHA